MNKIFSVSIIALLSVAHSMSYAQLEKATDVSFNTDVVPILTKLGCNGGGCHAKATGQNGFRLSLFGYEPEIDYDAITKEQRGRRLFIPAPAQSLLLLKASGILPHGGGKRIEVASADWQTLIRWIENGAPPSSAKDPVLTEIRVTPESLVFDETTRSQQLKITAQFSNGTTRDVTRQAIFQSNDPDVAEVSEAGLVRATKQSGLFAIMARYSDQIAVFRGTSLRAKVKPADLETLENWGKHHGKSPVDRHLVTQWKQLGVLPSPMVTDGEFIRRVTLDICGTLPTPDEVNSYLADSRPDKKSRLIDRLLDRPEYASYFALKWADILRNRGRGYGTSKQRAGTALFAGWIRDSIADNMPYDRFVTEIITAVGSQDQNPATVWYRTVRSTQDYVESTAQAFLGIRIQCAQCHHHPAERWSQADYYQLAAIFARVGRRGGFSDAEVPTSETIYLSDSGEVVHPRTGQAMAPRSPGGPAIKQLREHDPRQSFAAWMTAAENPYFARTMVNRIWGHFFGRGIIHPIDDARSTNPPSNPELLDGLTRDFVANKYDVKQLIRSICNSSAYALSSSTNDTNRNDVQSFARFYPRRMSAEVLLDAFSQTLQAPTKFKSLAGDFPLGTKAIDLPDEAVPSHFLDVFGRPLRNSACECERVDSPALGQTLALVSSPEIQEKLSAEKGFVAQLANNKKTHAENIRDIFVTVFARLPRPREQALAEEFLESQKNRKEAYQSLIWSLLATNEFLFNH